MMVCEGLWLRDADLERLPSPSCEGWYVSGFCRPVSKYDWFSPNVGDIGGLVSGGCDDTEPIGGGDVVIDRSSNR